MAKEGVVERLRNVVRWLGDRRRGRGGSDVGKRDRHRANPDMARSLSAVCRRWCACKAGAVLPGKRRPGRGRRVSTAAIRRGPHADTKNPRIIWNNDPRMPWSIHVSMPFPNPRGKAVMFQAGILTPGSSSGHVFPTHSSVTRLRPLSPVTAAGPSPIHTEFPFDPRTEEPETCG